VTKFNTKVRMTFVVDSKRIQLVCKIKFKNVPERKYSLYYFKNFT
jgi:hypothetical protein